MELLARIKRLVQWQVEQGFTAPVALGNYSYDYEKREITRNGKIVRLRNIENSILYELMRRSPNVVPYPVLIRAIWGEDYLDSTDSLKVHLRHLREKIEDDPSRPRIIPKQAGIRILFHQT